MNKRELKLISITLLIISISVTLSALMFFSSKNSNLKIIELNESNAKSYLKNINDDITRITYGDLENRSGLSNLPPSGKAVLVGKGSSFKFDKGFEFSIYREPDKMEIILVAKNMMPTEKRTIYITYPEIDGIVFTPFGTSSLSDIQNFIEKNKYNKNVFKNIIGEKRVIHLGDILEMSSVHLIAFNKEGSAGQYLLVLYPIIIGLAFLIATIIFKANNKDEINRKIRSILEVMQTESKTEDFDDEEIALLAKNHFKYIDSLRKNSIERNTTEIISALQNEILKGISKDAKHKFSFVVIRFIYRSDEARMICEKSTLFDELISESIENILEKGDHHTIVARNAGNIHTDFFAIINTKQFELPNFQATLSNSINIHINETMLAPEIEMVRFPDDGLYADKILRTAMSNLNTKCEKTTTEHQTRIKILNEFLDSASIDMSCVTIHYMQVIDIKSGRVAGLIASYSIKIPGYKPFAQEEISELLIISNKLVTIELALTAEALATLTTINDLGKGNIYVAVTVSDRTLRSKRFVELISSEETTKNTKIRNLIIYINNQSIVNNDLIQHENLRDLNKKGIEVMINNLPGEGNRLNYYTKFNVSKMLLQIDKSLANSSHDSKDIAFIKSIIQTLSDFGIDTILTNIDDISNLKIAVRTSCKYIQGNAFGGKSSLFNAIEAIENGYEFVRSI